MSMEDTVTIAVQKAIAPLLDDTLRRIEAALVSSRGDTNSRPGNSPRFEPTKPVPAANRPISSAAHDHLEHHLAHNDDTLQRAHIETTKRRIPAFLHAIDVNPASVADEVARSEDKRPDDEEKQHSSCPDLLLQCLEHPLFEKSVAGVLVLNVAFIAYATNYALANPLDTVSSFIATGELLFAIVFLLELVSKMVAYRLEFWTGPMKAWNIFDFILVLFSVVDVVVYYSFGSSVVVGGLNPSFLRVLRLMRLSKIFRTIRLIRDFKNMRVIIDCIIASMGALFWAMALILAVFFISTIILLNGAALVLADDDVNSTDKNQLMEHWGSVELGVLTLYKATTGGDDWTGLAEPLLLIGTFNYGVFLIVIFFVHVSVFNILTGIYVDTAMKCLEVDRTSLVYDHLEEEHIMVRELSRTFQAMIGQGRESAPMEDIKAAVQNPEVRAYLSVLGVQAWDMEQFLSVLEHKNQSGQKEIDLPTFVHTAMLAQGNAKSMDICTLSVDVSLICQQVHEIQHTLAVLHKQFAERPEETVCTVTDAPPETEQKVVSNGNRGMSARMESIQMRMIDALKLSHQEALQACDASFKGQREQLCAHHEQHTVAWRAFQEGLVDDFRVESSKMNSDIVDELEAQQIQEQVPAEVAERQLLLTVAHKVVQPSSSCFDCPSDGEIISVRL